MRTALIVALLVVGVSGALRPPRRLPLAAFPVVAALVAVGSGAVSYHVTRAALDALGEPLAFLLLAVPLAAFLDELEVFDAAAAVVTGERVALGCWVLGCVVVAVLNLDAAVVLLTPIYVRLARRLGIDAVALAFQPALLACLASCALPVSNLTNLIAVHERHLDVHAFTAALWFPSVVAVAAGYWGWRLAFRNATVRPTKPEPNEIAIKRPLAIGAGVLVVLLAGFLFGDHVGFAPWAIVAIVDGALALFTRRVPWRSTPLDPAFVALGLAVLAAGVAARIDLGRLLAPGGGGGAIARDAGVTALVANVCNNLPAFLVLSPFARGSADAPWAVLLGANLGPVLAVTGSLSGLLWLTVARREGLAVGAGTYFRVGLVAGTPAFVLATAAFAFTR